eukprot:jgi/Tetstr1/425562/TSEL_015985.t1
MDSYHKGAVIGQGGSSKVYRGVHKQTHQVVALKKIRLGHVDDGVNMSAVREIKALREVAHPQLIRMLDVFPHKQNIFVVYEYMESNLEAMLHSHRRAPLTEAVVKAYLKAVLEPLALCHGAEPALLHRDIKPNNLLVAADGSLRLTDFGLSRVVPAASASPKTVQIGHLWYRAPEVLLGDAHYGPGVDVWALGCVFAELMLGRPLFRGRSDLDQLTQVFQQLGPPPAAALQGLRLSDCLVMFQGAAGVPLPETFSGAAGATAEALALLGAMLAVDPAQRISAAAALAHPFFRTGQPPAGEAQLPKPCSWAPPSEEIAANQGHGEPGRRTVLFKATMGFRTPSAAPPNEQPTGATTTGGSVNGEGRPPEATPASEQPPVTLSRLRFSTGKKESPPRAPPSAGTPGPGADGGGGSDGRSPVRAGTVTPTGEDARVVSNLFVGDTSGPRSPRGFPHPQLMALLDGDLEDAEVVPTGLTPPPLPDDSHGGTSSARKRKIGELGGDDDGAARSLF